MLEKMREELIAPIMGNKSEIFLQRIQSLSGDNRVKELKKIAPEFSLNTEMIIKDIYDCLENNSYEDIKNELQKDADTYQKYYTKFNNEDFLYAQEIFLTIHQYIDRIVGKTQKHLTKILLKYPWIEEERAVIAKAYGLPTKDSTEASPIVSIEQQEETVNEAEQSFIDKVEDILSSLRWEKEKTQTIEKIFLETYNLQRMMWKRLYKNFGLEEKYVWHIKEIHLELLSLLIKQTKQENDKEKMIIQWEIDTIMKEYLPQKPTWPNVVGKIDLSTVYNRPSPKHKENKLPPTFDPLVLVGKKMGKRNFLAAFALNYEEIKVHIADKISVPARYSNSTPIEWGFLHFFTIGQDKRGSETPIINVCIKNGGRQFADGEICEVYLTDMDQTENPNIKRQTYNIRGIFAENAPKPNPGLQTLADNPELVKLKEKLDT